MTRRARRSAALLGLLLLTGCPAGDPSAGRAPGPVRAPATAGPAVSAAATVDLSSAVPGLPATATVAAATPDGGADVVVTPEVEENRPVLVRVDAGSAVGAPVRLPGLTQVQGLAELPDGEVLVSGDDAGSAALVVVDPRSGEQRPLWGSPGQPAARGAAVASDGATAYLLATGSTHSELFALDVVSGTLLAARDLTDDVAAVSAAPLTPYTATLLPRSAGGVGIVFDARPDDAPAGSVPALLEYDTDLTPSPGSGLLGGGGTVTAGVAGTRGTVFLALSTPDGASVASVDPVDSVVDGAAVATPLVRLPAATYGYALAVDPWQGWAVTPAPGGIVAANLATGGTRRADVDCPGEADVRGLAAATAAGTVLVTGRCGAPLTGRPTLWVLHV